MSVDSWIRELVPGKDFADVGGLWGLVNEKVSCAAMANARSVTMIDITPADSDLWQQFHDRCAAKGIATCRCIASDINNTAVAGSFDVLHCSGLLYHCSAPLVVLRRLRQLCRGHLLLGTTVIVASVDDGPEHLRCEPGGALFIPALSEARRQVAARYFHRVGATTMIGLETPSSWNPDDYEPWWWLFTIDHVRAMLASAGFYVHDTWTTWGDRVAYFHASAQ